MVLHCETDCNGFSNNRKKSRKSEQKSATSVTKVLYRQYGGSLCNRLQRHLSNDRKKSEKSKKSDTSVTNVFYRQYGGSLCNRLQRDLSNDRKKSEKSEKKCNKCNKGIIYAVWLFIVKQTATRFVRRKKKNQRSLKKAQQV